MSEQKLTRRDFLKLAGTTGAAVVVLGARSTLRPKASGEGPESEHRWVMVIDQAKCIGCGYCTLACRANNDVPPDISWNRVLEAGQVGDQPVFLPRPCQHCEHAPCVEVCMVGASYRRPDGIVMMNYDKCIGCRYCEIACPYGARAFNWEAFTGDNPAVPKW